jgi:hypothetical protein
MSFFDRPPSELTPFPAVAFASSAVARTFLEEVDERLALVPLTALLRAERRPLIWSRLFAMASSRCSTIRCCELKVDTSRR